MNEAKFESQLHRFLHVLRKEKKVLVTNKPDKLEAFVTQKSTYLSLFEEYQGPISERMKELIHQIKAQQEENLLLTEQAISYQNMLMNAVKKTMKTSSQTTYSKQMGTPNHAPTAMINTEF